MLITMKEMLDVAQKINLQYLLLMLEQDNY